MSEIKKLLTEIGQELGRTEAQMQQYVDILEGEWYDTVDSLKPITDTQWEKFGLPGRLVDKIKMRVHGSAPASAPAAAPAAPAAAPSPAPATPAPPPTTVTTSSSAPPTSSSSPSDLEKEKHLTAVKAFPENDVMEKSFDILVALVATTIPREDGLMATALTTLVKLTDGILANPENDKTRKIREANPGFHDKCGKYPACIDYLTALGFKRDGEFLIMPVAYHSRLNDGRNALTRIAEEANITLPQRPGTFNPYVATSTAMAAQPAQANAKRAKEAEQIKHELERKRRELETQGDNTALSSLAPPRAFWQAAAGRLEDAIKVLNQQLEDQDADTQLLTDTLKCMQASDAGKFRSRQKEELDALSKQKVYHAAILRVNMPNKVVLELNFKPKTTWQDVYQAVEACLTEEAKFVEWYLYQTPPVHKFQRNKETLLGHKLVPGAVVFLGVDNRETDVPKLGTCVNATLYAALGPEPKPPTPIVKQPGGGVFEQSLGKRPKLGHGQSSGKVLGGSNKLVEGATMVHSLGKRPSMGNGQHKGNGEDGGSTAAAEDLQKEGTAQRTGKVSGASCGTASGEAVGAVSGKSAPVASPRKGGEDKEKKDA